MGTHPDADCVAGGSDDQALSARMDVVHPSVHPCWHSGSAVSENQLEASQVLKAGMISRPCSQAARLRIGSRSQSWLGCLSPRKPPDSTSNQSTIHIPMTETAHRRLLRFRAESLFASPNST